MNIVANAGGLPESTTIVQLLSKLPLIEKWAEHLLLWEDIFSSFFIAIVLSLIAYFGAKKREMIPHGFQNFLELLIETVQNVANHILGKDNAREHIPFLGTLFIYIFVMNILGLVPFMKSPSSSLSISIGMALCVFARVQYLNVKNMSLKGYLYHMSGSPKNLVSWAIAPLMFVIEVITQLSRPITLALRLTGNVMGEHALISIFTLLSLAIFSVEGVPFGLPIQAPAMLFGLVTSLMQAAVFTLLTTVYILLSIPDKSENH